MAVSAKDKDLSISGCCSDSQLRIGMSSCLYWVKLIVWYKSVPRTNNTATVALEIGVISVTE